MTSVTVVETLASNVRAFRLLRELEQEKLARRMQALGQQWRQVTVSEVERRRRMVTVPELLALTIALGATVQQLLDPRGPERIRGPRLDVSDRVTLQQIGGQDQTVTVVPADAVAMVCSHETVMDVQWDDEHDRIAVVLFSHPDQIPAEHVEPEAQP